MNKFQLIDPDLFDFSPFRLIGKDWMLITAEKEGKINSMTASWGGLGVIWGKNCAFIFVRRSRYTKEFIDGSDGFSLSFFDHEKYKKLLTYMGSVSGRNEDKISKSGLTISHYEGIPYYDEASKILICKKMYCQPICPENFIFKEIDDKWYKDKDYHDLYIGEIIAILKS
uniref:Flavin reductase family protein n=1 Tax=Thermodesulfobium narugense TaxID=184064 RepID=A0A7C5P709_9BACT